LIRRLVLAAVALAAGAVAAGTFAAGAGVPSPAPSPGIRGELDASGLQALLASQRGRTVLVNFWATWCEPCREEFPSLDRLERELSPRGFSVIGISTDFASQTAAVEAFLRKTRPSFANYRKKSGGDDQPFIEAVDPHWGGELPFSVIYAPDGSRARTVSGKRSYSEYRRQVLDVMEEAKKMKKQSPAAGQP
jgi:thiol-disulfide isomerase/thioredoxin